MKRMCLQSHLLMECRSIDHMTSCIYETGKKIIKWNLQIWMELLQTNSELCSKNLRLKHLPADLNWQKLHRTSPHCNSTAPMGQWNFLANKTLSPWFQSNTRIWISVYKCGKCIHWVCVYFTELTPSKSVSWAIIGSDNSLSLNRRQTIIWTNAELFLIVPCGTNFSEIWIQIPTFLFKKMSLKMSSGKWRPFCFGLWHKTIFINIAAHSTILCSIFWSDEK